MAWNTLKSAIADVIKTNGNQEITGAVLQSTLNSIVNAVGENATFAGIATPTTNPGTPDGPVFYIATTAGSYSNFGNIEISKGESAILKWNNGIWTKNTFKPMTDFNSVYDLDGNNLTKTFERLHTKVSNLEEDAKIVLASMGTAVDNEGNDSDVAIGYVPSVGDRYYDSATGHIKWVKSSTVTEDLGLPSEDRIYCNGMTKRLYVFENGWKKVDKIDITQSTGTSTTAVMSQKAVSDVIAVEETRAKDAEENLDNKVTDLESRTIYDVSSNNGGEVFESISTLLNSSDLDTLIPISVRHGGMMIRFIQGSEQSSDNKYVQARCMADAFTTDTTQWQGVDDEPVAGSENLVKSGGVAYGIEHSAFGEYNKRSINSIYGDLVTTFDWAVGSIDSSTGEFGNTSENQKKNISTPDIITLSEAVTVTNDTGYTVYVFYFQNGSYVKRKEVQLAGLPISAGQYKFMVVNSTNPTVQTTIYNLLSHIHSTKITGILRDTITKVNNVEQIANISSDNAENLRTIVDSIKKDVIYNYPWAIGSISSSTGEYDPNVNYMIATQSIVTLTKETTYTIDADYTMNSFVFSNGSYAGRYATTTGGTRTLQAGTYKFSMVKNSVTTKLNSIYPHLGHLSSDDIIGDESGLNEILIEEGSVWE